MGATPLHLACAAGNVSVVSLLARAAPETLNRIMPPLGRTGLHLASEWGHTHCVSALLAAGADAAKTDAQGKQARHVFAGAESDVQRLFGPDVTPARSESPSSQKV